MPISKKTRGPLPYELFEHIIIPDLFAEYIHSSIIDLEPPTGWNPFYTLPLVCRDFNETCRKMVPSVFGDRRGSRPRSPPPFDEQPEDVEQFEEEDADLEDEVFDGGDLQSERSEYGSPSDYDSDSDNEASPDPRESIKFARQVCQRALRPTSDAGQTYIYFGMNILMNNPCLVQMYMCFGVGKLTLNRYVLQPLGILVGKVKAQGSPWDPDYGTEYEVTLPKTPVEDSKFYMPFMPFLCAQRICDHIRPDRLTYTGARYMADVLPFYHSISILIKYAMDLRFNVDRKYNMDLSDYASWCSSTLNCLEDSENLLRDMLSTSKIITSCCSHGGRIPRDTIKHTAMLEALQGVAEADWGDRATTASIRGKARKLLLKWTPPV